MKYKLYYFIGMLFLCTCNVSASTDDFTVFNEDEKIRSSKTPFDETKVTRTENTCNELVYDNWLEILNMADSRSRLQFSATSKLNREFALKTAPAGTITVYYNIANNDSIILMNTIRSCNEKNQQSKESKLSIFEWEYRPNIRLKLLTTDYFKNISTDYYNNISNNDPLYKKLMKEELDHIFKKNTYQHIKEFDGFHSLDLSDCNYVDDRFFKCFHKVNSIIISSSNVTGRDLNEANGIKHINFYECNFVEGTKKIIESCDLDEIQTCVTKNLKTLKSMFLNSMGNFETIIVTHPLVLANTGVCYIPYHLDDDSINAVFDENTQEVSFYRGNTQGTPKILPIIEDD